LLERERRKAAKVDKEMKEKEVLSVEALVVQVLEAVGREEFPESAEGKEAYFLEKVAVGENLIKQGEAYYDESVEHFYKALKIYPAPLELIMIYQKTLPEKVFRIVVNIMALEQQKRQTQFYDEFPPKELSLKLKQLDKTGTEDERDLYGLVADKDFEQGIEMYSETPMISALRPELEVRKKRYSENMLIQF
jgi:import receptor subunit TOM20